jgi:hypothetical protein
MINTIRDTEYTSIGHFRFDFIKVSMDKWLKIIYNSLGESR